MYKLLQNILPTTIIKSLKFNNIIVPLLQKTFHAVYNYPKILQLHINSDCNLNCRYCYSKRDITPKLNWNNVLNQAKKLKVKKVEFLGGEPFLDPRLKQYINFCDKNNISVKIYTNGTLIDEHWINYLIKLKETPVLVFKYDDEISYDDYTGKGTYKTIKHNMKLCNKSGLNVHGHMVINSKNYDKLKAVIDSVKEADVTITIERYMEVGTSIDRELALNVSQWNDALSTINEYYRGFSEDYIVNSIIKGNTCSCYIDLLSIDVEGFVKPCPFSEKSQIIGDIKSENLHTIWERFLRLRKTWLKIPDECKKCKYKHMCHGGCKTMTYSKKKTYNAKDPLCNESLIPTSIYSDKYLK